MALRLACVWSTYFSMKHLPPTLCYFSAVKSEVASIWMSDTSVVSFDQRHDVISVKHIIVYASIHHFLMPFQSVMMAELLWLPYGTLKPRTPVLCVWFDPKWLPLVPRKPQCGFLQSRGRWGPDSRRLVQADSYWARGRDACQLCKAQISPCFSFKKRKKSCQCTIKDVHHCYCCFFIRHRCLGVSVSLAQ